MDIRERIIEGAASLFKNYGIKAVTMDSLANHIGMSKRTIYENFSDKDEILEAVLHMMTERQKILVKRILDDSDNAIDAIFRLLETNRDHFQEISPAFHADIRKYYHKMLMSNVAKFDMPDYRNNAEVLEKGIKQNLFRKEINTDIVNRCLFALGRSTMDSELYPFEDFTRREVIKNVFINYLRGISTEEGVQLIEKHLVKF
jgi:TetR/AcrR family transcriptional regulator, cholesterol catabolism regulator